MILTRKFEFDSGHHLDVSDREKKSHGHRYVLEVSVEGPAVRGFIIGIDEIKNVVNREVIEKLDHNYLNEIVENPTMENLIVWIWGKVKPHLPALSKLKLYETPNNFVTYYGKG